MSAESRTLDLIASLSYYFTQTRLFFNLKWAEVRSTSFCISLLNAAESGETVLLFLVCVVFQLITRAFFWSVMGTLWMLFHMVLFDACLAAIAWRVLMYLGAAEDLGDQQMRHLGCGAGFIVITLFDFFGDIMFWQAVVHRDAHQQFLMFFFRMAFDIIFLVAIHHAIVPLLETYRAFSLWFNGLYKRLYDKFKRAD